MGRRCFVKEDQVVATGTILQWGPVWGGLLSTFRLMVVLGLVGLAVGLGNIRSATTGQLGTASLIWGVVITLLSFFVGGWIAGRATSHPGKSFTGFMVGSVVWALGVTLAVLFTAMGVGGAAGAALSIFGILAIAPAAGAVSAAQNAAIGTLIGLVLAYIACVVGAMAGANARGSVDDVRVR